MSAATMTMTAGLTHTAGSLQARRPASARTATRAFLMGPGCGGRAYYRRPQNVQFNAACRPGVKASWGASVNGQPMTLQQMMQAWEKATFGQSPYWQEAIINLGLPVDMMESEQEYTFVADIPGLAKEDLKVRVNKDRQLTISGERKRPQQQQQQAKSQEDTTTTTSTSDSEAEAKDATSSKQRQRLERRFGAFSRTIPLPSDADTGSISATVERGVLTLTVKRLEKDPDVTEIPIY